MQILLVFALIIGTQAFLRPIPGNLKAKWGEPKLQRGFEKGIDIEFEERPFHAEIKVFGRSLCSGAWIGKRAILTSGACCDGIKNADSPYVKLDAIYDVEKIAIHPQFDDYNIQNDLCVITVDKEITDAIAEPATLGPSNPSDGEILVISYLNGAHLQKSFALFASDESCTDIYGGDFSENMICAVPDPDTFDCNIQTGSPMTFNDILIGTSSWGYDCSKPEVFTQLDAHLDWIFENMY